MTGPRIHQRTETRTMSLQTKLKHELKAMLAAALYFGCWIGMLLVMKSLILAEYQIEFLNYSMAIVGALILSKVVLILEHVSLGLWVKQQPAWVDVVLRTALYSAGVVVVMVLEKGFEGRHEHGGFAEAVRAAVQSAESYHVWANAICISAALLSYNILSVIRRHLGKGGILGLLARPLPTARSGSNAPDKDLAVHPEATR
jgi:hypothetical protein